MSVVNRQAFLRLDARSRPRTPAKALYAGAVTGALLRNAPAQVTGLQAQGILRAVRFSWDTVTTTEAGKPLESLARYLVFYKYDRSEDILDEDIENLPDGIIEIDNTSIILPIGRVAYPGTDFYETQWVGVRVAAKDRFGRVGRLSSGVVATTLYSLVPEMMDWGLVTEYDPESEGGVEYTIVRSWPTLNVPNGYWYVVTVFPLGMINDRPPVLDPDFGPWISNFTHGLWWADEISGGPSWPYLPPGTYHNVKIAVMHSIFSSCYATCFDPSGGPITNQPLYAFDPVKRGDLRIAGRIQENALMGLGQMPMPAYFERQVFQPVYWVIWKVPL